MECNLYYGVTFYHILNCILHKMIVAENERAVLYVSDICIKNCPQFCQRLKKEKIFQDVVLFEERKFRSEGFPSPKLDIEERKRIYVNYVSSKLEPTFSLYSNYIIAAGIHAFGLYLAANKIPYIYMEDGCGDHSRSKESLQGMLDASLLKHLILDYGLLGENEYIVKRYLDIKAQKEDYKKDKKDIDFSVSKIMLHLPKEKREKLKRIFQVEKIDVSKVNHCDVLFLPQNNVGQNIITIKEQKLQTSLLMDFFSSKGERVLIKPHPSDSWVEYRYPNVYAMPSNFPIEVLLFLNKKFKRAITPWSTSIRSLYPIIEKTFEFTQEVDISYKKIFLYYSIYLLIDRLKEKNTIIFVSDIYIPLLQNIFDFYSIDENSILIKDLTSYRDITKNSILIIDDNSKFKTNAILAYIHRKKIKVPIIFPNSSDKHIFFDGSNYAFYKNMFFWKYEVYDNEGYKISGKKFWIYMENKEMKEKVNYLEFCKKLEKSQLELHINDFEQNLTLVNRQRIMRDFSFLESVLEITQKRLDSLREENYHLKKNDVSVKPVENRVMSSLIRKNKISQNDIYNMRKTYLRYLMLYWVSFSKKRKIYKRKLEKITKQIIELT